MPPRAGVRLVRKGWCCVVVPVVPAIGTSFVVSYLRFQLRSASILNITTVRDPSTEMQLMPMRLHQCSVGAPLVGARPQGRPQGSPLRSVPAANARKQAMRREGLPKKSTPVRGETSGRWHRAGPHHPNALPYHCEHRRIIALHSAMSYPLPHAARKP